MLKGEIIVLSNSGEERLNTLEQGDNIGKKHKWQGHDQDLSGWGLTLGGHSSEAQEQTGSGKQGSRLELGVSRLRSIKGAMT